MMTEEVNLPAYERLAKFNAITLHKSNQTCMDYSYDNMIKELRNLTWSLDGGLDFIIKLCLYILGKSLDLFTCYIMIFSQLDSGCIRHVPNSDFIKHLLVKLTFLATISHLNSLFNNAKTYLVKSMLLVLLIL